MKRFLRPTAKKSDIIPLAVLLSIAFIVAGDLIGVGIMALTGRTNIIESLTNGSENLSAFMSNYLACIGIWIALIFFILIPKKNRPMLKDLGYHKKGNTVSALLLGLLLGFGLNAFCIAGALITGDIKLSFFGFEPLTLLMFLVAVFIQSGSEELVMRLYLYRKLRRRYTHPAVAILTNSLLFMLLHILNPGFNIFSALQIFFVGLFFSLVVYYKASFWAVTTLHTGWNFTQNILFGLPNSGLVSEYSLFKLEAASAKSGFFYDVAFGVEGSIGSCILLFLACVVTFLIYRGKGERLDLWQE